MSCKYPPGSLQAFLSLLLLLFTLPSYGQVALASGDEPSGVISAPLQQNTYSFHADEGDTLYLTIGVLSTGTPGHFDPGFKVYRPGGEALSWPDSVTAPDTGTYTVVVSDFDGSWLGTHMGSYQLHFLRIPGPFAIADDGGSLANGGNQVAQIQSPADIDAWTFQANEGDTFCLSIAATASETPAHFSPSFKVYGPDGSRVTGAFDSITAPDSGTYTVVVAAYSGSWISSYTGSYRLHFLRIPGQFVIADDGGTLTNGGNHDAQIQIPTDIDAWTFQANAGDTFCLSIAATASETPAHFSPSFKVYGPDGSRILGNPDSLKAPASGIYTVVVAAYSGSWISTYTGSYRLHFFRIPGPFVVADDGGPLTNGGTQTAQIGSPGDIDGWTFHANAGDRFQISLSSLGGTSGFDPGFKLYDPSGDRILGVGTLTASMTGTYTVVVISYYGSNIGTATGGYSLYFSLALPPVIFIPGIAGSNLAGGNYHGNGSYLWPTIRPDKMEDLHLTEGVQDVQAVGVLETFVLAGDIGLPLITAPIYGPFLDHLRGSGYTEFPLDEDPSRLTSVYLLSQSWVKKPNLFTFPYDWRKDIASHTGTLRTYISHIRQLHGGAKVRVVSHSMGALLLRRYMIDYGTDDLASVVTVAPPAWGTPQAVYRMHTGLFFGPDWEKFPIDWITRDAMKASLWSFPAVAQLLPSSYYMLHGGALIFSEAGWDYNRNGDSSEIYDPVDYFKLMTDEAIRQGGHINPILVNQAFHTVAQSDWSDIPASIPVLQITGRARKLGIFETTPWSMVAHGGPWWASLNPGGIGATIFDHQRIDPIYGPGDGTVALLSSERFAAYLAPNTIVRPINGDGEATHMGLFSENPEVAEMIASFLRTGSAPPAAPAPSPRIPRGPEDASPLVSILIKGREFVSVKNGDGDGNTRYTEMAAAKVPRVEIRYAKDSVMLGFATGEAVSVEDEAGAGGTTPLEVEIVNLDGSGNLSSLRRYRAELPAGRWRIQEDEDGTISLFADADADGIYQPGEELAPVQVQEGESMDTTAPRIALEILKTGQGVSVTLSGTDNSGAVPALRYALDAGPVENYAAPIPLARGSTTKLVAFAEDAVGNTSGLIETTIQPAVTPGTVTEGSFRMSWPAAAAYILEESGDLSGPWTEVVAPVQQSADEEWIEIPVTESQRFYRLNSRTLHR